MSTVALIAAVILVFASGLLLVVSLCMAARDGDEALERARRERHQEREAASKLYGPGGGWRAP